MNIVLENKRSSLSLIHLKNDIFNMEMLWEKATWNSLYMKECSAENRKHKNKYIMQKKLGNKT